MPPGETCWTRAKISSSGFLHFFWNAFCMRKRKYFGFCMGLVGAANSPSPSEQGNSILSRVVLSSELLVANQSTLSCFIAPSIQGKIVSGDLVALLSLFGFSISTKKAQVAKVKPSALLRTLRFPTHIQPPGLDHEIHLYQDQAKRIGRSQKACSCGELTK